MLEETVWVNCEEVGLWYEHSVSKNSRKMRLSFHVTKELRTGFGTVCLPDWLENKPDASWFDLVLKFVMITLHLLILFKKSVCVCKVTTLVFHYTSKYCQVVITWFEISPKQEYLCPMWVHQVTVR